MDNKGVKLSRVDVSSARVWSSNNFVPYKRRKTFSSSSYCVFYYNTYVITNFVSLINISCAPHGGSYFYSETGMTQSFLY